MERLLSAFYRCENSSLQLPGLAALIVCAIGGVVLTGWALELPALTSPVSDWISMKPNTAVAFVLCGVALWLLQHGASRPRTRWLVRGLVAPVLILAALTLSEYLFSWNPGIDQWLFEDQIGAANNQHPGRMAPNTTLCLAIAGVALLLLSRRQHKALLLVEAAAAFLIAVGAIALLGYLVDMAAGYQWWDLNGMALLTALAFVALGAGLMGIAMAEERAAWAIGHKLTAAFLAGLALVLALIGVTYSATGNLQETAHDVARTQAIRFHASQILSAAQDLQHGYRGYLLTGDDSFLTRHETGARTIPRELAALEELVAPGELPLPGSMEPGQLAALQAMLAEMMALTAQPVNKRRRLGTEAAMELVRDGQERALMTRIRSRIAGIDDQQATLAAQHQQASGAASAMAFFVLPVAGLLSLTILPLVFLLLNRKAWEHQQAQANLKSSEALFRGMAENMLQIVWTSRPDGRIDYFNQRWIDYTGAGLERDRDWGWNQAVHPDDLQRCIQAWTEAVSRGEPFEVEHRVKRADGAYRWHIGRATPLRDGPNHNQGRIVRWVGTATDIHDTKQLAEETLRLNLRLEQRVRERTALLETANQELEAFSYSVSHDLRAPLRHVQGYVELLSTTAADTLSDQARHYLDTIDTASEEMGRLIDDLLAFSRIGRTECQDCRVCLDDLVQSTVRQLETSGRDQPARWPIHWQIAPLPTVIGDPSLLKLIFTNLIDNAIKYSRNRNPAVIEIGCAGDEDGRRIVFVQDNGAGFDMRYAHKLFGVFQRLHNNDEFTGNGIGLATVRRILTRQGGRIWAEAAPGQGATFYLTLQPVSGD